MKHARGDSFREQLLAWYRRQCRPLPWRETRDPYRIWISEIMLQQTRVATVVGFYERWIKRFPNCEALARADIDDVLHAWQGLGYYSRARNLQRAAAVVVRDHDGRLPASVAELRQLPGVGAYSAGAIASIAFGLDEPAVDGNVIRVLSRLFRIPGHAKQVRMHREIAALARQLLPKGRAGSFNQALMELGATHCSPRSPSCHDCPVRTHCQARAHGQVDRFPQPPPRPALIEERRAVALIRRRGRFLLAKARTDAPRWSGMWQFPDAMLPSPPLADRTWLEREMLRQTGLAVVVEQRADILKHQVTRHRIELQTFACRAPSGRARVVDHAALRWCNAEQLGELAMPAPHRKIARRLVEPS